MTVQAMYIGEIASDDMRGSLGSFMNLFFSLGFLAMNSIGPFLSFVVVQWALMLFAVASLVLLIPIPESPYYYAIKNQREDALRSLSFLRNKPVDDVASEYKQIEIHVSQSETEESSAGGLRELFTSAANLKALMICGVLMSCHVLSGIAAVMSYAASILKESGLSMADSDMTVIVLCLFQLVARLVAPFLAFKWGRKPLLLFSCGFLTLFLVAFVVYQYGIERQIGAFSGLTWLPVVALIGNLIAFSWGLASVPWTLTAEIFPSNVKSSAVAIVTCIDAIASFLLTRFFQPLSLDIGSYSVFSIFAGFAALGFFFTLFAVFETKGLSLIEVQMRLRQKGGKKKINGRRRYE